MAVIESKKQRTDIQLNNSLFQVFEEKASRVTIDCLCLGLGYTMVVTLDGGIGLAYTYFETKKTCMLNKGYEDPEGKPAVRLLEKIFSNDPIQRSMALAVINALNYESAVMLTEERDNRALLGALNVKEGTKVAMVGFFRPLVALIKEKKAIIEVLDVGKNLGEKETFYQKIGEWADVLILTSTTILNNTTEDILRHSNPAIKTVLLGPSTPIIKEPFTHLPIHLLAGTVPVDRDQTFKAIRHGTGTPVIQKFGRKVVLDIEGSSPD